MALEDRVRIPTPEGIEVDLVLAGLGSRFSGLLLDTFIQVVAMVAVLTVLGASDIGGGWIVALTFIAMFLVLFGYFIAFETFGGRTPGKMAAGTRVVQLGGQPIGFFTSAVRNIVRIVDFLPAWYAVGAVTILATQRNQRLGDLAAATIVVRERMPADAHALPGGDASAGATGALTTAGYASSTIPPPPSTGTPEAPWLSWDVSAVTPAEVAVARRFLDRRLMLDPGARWHLAAQLAGRLRPKVHGAPADWHDEIFLQGIAAAKAARGA